MSRYRGRVVLVFAIAFLGGGLMIWGNEVRLAAKAAVAHHLIARAFEQHLRDGQVHRPWHWADMHPIATLEFPQRNVKRDILTGATGESMAFGVGHLTGTAIPNQRGNCVVAGHRDGDFRFLQVLQPGDKLLLRSHENTKHWIVKHLAVVSMYETWPTEWTSKPRLTLVTCFPFGGVLRSSLRLVVVCRPAETG